MEKTFKIEENEIKETVLNEANLIIYKNISDADEEVFLLKYDLPKDVFYFDDLKPVAPRYEEIENFILGNTLIFVLSNVVPSKEHSDIEERLESHVYILGEKQLFWFIKDGQSNLDKDLFNHHSDDVDSLQSVIMYSALISYTNFANELSYQKEQIDYLNKQADKKTSNRILSQVADTERNLVILEHTISTQESAIRRLLNDAAFVTLLNNKMLVHDVKWYNRQVNKLVHVYRDLFDAVSSLYSDIVTNNLNQLMKIFKFSFDCFSRFEFYC